MLNPGPEMDIFIAEKILGWFDVEGVLDSLRGHALGGVLPEVPHFSTDIKDAWEVVERLFEQGWDMDIQMYQNDERPEVPSYRVDIQRIENQEQGWAAIFGDTAPEAICRAALQTLEPVSGGDHPPPDEL